MTLEDWVKKNWGGLELLGAATQQYRPGVILSNDGGMEVQSAAWALLGEQKTDPFWQTERSEALLVEREFEEERGFGGSIKIPGIVAITLKSNKQVKASFSVEGVEAELLVNAFESDINTKLHDKLKSQHSDVWTKYVDDHPVITESWYMRKLMVSFEGAGGSQLSADVQADINVSAAGNVDWKTKSVVHIESPGKVPFAVRTFRP